VATHEIAVGRWGGRLTSRPLPIADPTIDGLSDPQRDELAAVWLARAQSERRVADAFVVIRSSLAELGADASIARLAERAVGDEHRHAEIARVVASRFAGRELEPPERLELVVPEHAGASGALRATLHVVGHCAINETLASAFLELTRAQSQPGLARAAVRELLSDEIDHARIGWAHLAALSASDRRRLTPWLGGLLAANLGMWRRSPRPYPTDPKLTRHGAPREDDVERALVGALRDLVLPGFERVGLETGALRAWLARGAPTRTPL